MEFTGYIIRTSIMLVMMLLCVVAWSAIPRPRPLAYVLFGGLSLVGLVTELTGFSLILLGYRTYYIYNAYALIELSLIVGIVMRFDRDLRSFALTVGLVGGLSLIMNAYMDRSIGPVLWDGVLVISVLQALVLLVMLWRMAMTSERPLHKVPEFWLFMGLLVYFGGMAPFFALIRFVYANDPVVANVLWTLMPILCSIRYAMGAWSCLLKRREALRPADG